MSTDISLTLFEDVQVVVPDAFDRLTPYVLREQQDWFDDEIRFLRRLLTPGQTVVDIGAKYGVYTLSMAKSVGRTGRVFAFEPATSKADRLARSIANNGFNQVVLQRSAVAEGDATMRLVQDDRSEIRNWKTATETAAISENVATTSLDSCLDRLQWQAVDFLKIDCQPSKIVVGGVQFFDRLSPLVQYRIQGALAADMGSLRTFSARGYDCYRLVPGLGLLVPFEFGTAPDVFLRHLFFCKKDRAMRLAAGGFLLQAEAVAQARDAAAIARYAQTCRSHDAYRWRKALVKFPYGQMLANSWEATMAGAGAGEVEIGLALFAQSCDAQLAAADRFGALESALQRFDALCQADPSFLRLASLARIARAYGARMVAVEALRKLLETSFRQEGVNALEPFLVPCERFEQVAPIVNQGGPWVFAATLEAMELWHDYSSFYAGPEDLARLHLIRQLGFVSDEMKRRLDLMQMRFPSAA